MRLYLFTVLLAACLMPALSRGQEFSCVQVCLYPHTISSDTISLLKVLCWCGYVAPLPTSDDIKLSTIGSRMLGTAPADFITPPTTVRPQDATMANQPQAIIETKKPDTTAAPTTTTNVCDLLCSIQMGGDACNCSNAALPG